METAIGAIKIKQMGKTDDDPSGYARRPVLRPVFLELDPKFISLGQDEDYYLNLRKLAPDIATATLAALRDIACRPQLASDFEAASQFRNGLRPIANPASTSSHHQRTLVMAR